MCTGTRVQRSSSAEGMSMNGYKEVICRGANLQTLSTTQVININF